MNRIGKFFALSLREKTLLLEALLQLQASRITLSLRGIPQQSLSVSDSCNMDVIVQARYMVDAAASIGLHKNTCLEKSIALRSMLRRRGIGTVLRIGCTAPENFQAHAWLEINGQPINDSPDIATRFEPLSPGGYNCQSKPSSTRTS
jgi:hypothetical protein